MKYQFHYVLLAILVLTILIIVSRVFYVAKLNPSESLRYE